MKKDEIKSIVNKIVTDYALYISAVETYKKLNVNWSKADIENMTLRSNIKMYINKREADKGYLLAKDQVDVNCIVMLRLRELSFVDFVSRGMAQQGMEFAKKHFSLNGDADTVHYLVGCDGNDHMKMEHIRKKLDTQAIIDEINAILYEQHTGRDISLLHSTVEYHNSAMDIQKE